VPYATTAVAERENLIKPGPAVFVLRTSATRARLRRLGRTVAGGEPRDDFAVVRLGAPGIVRGVVIGYRLVQGNYPPFASVERPCAEGYPSPAELERANGRPSWSVPLARDAENSFR